MLCRNKHPFEAWFPNFDACQEQIERKQISCPACGTTEVKKVPHACAVISQRGEKEEAKQVENSPPPLTEDDARELLIKLHHHIRENFEDVGPRFAEEARAIFYGQSEPKPIHGTATAEEREELDDQAIPYAILPKPKLDS